MTKLECMERNVHCENYTYMRVHVLGAYNNLIHYHYRQFRCCIRIQECYHLEQGTVFESLTSTGFRIQ